MHMTITVPSRQTCEMSLPRFVVALPEELNYTCKLIFLSSILVFCGFFFFPVKLLMLFGDTALIMLIMILVSEPFFSFLTPCLLSSHSHSLFCLDCLGSLNVSAVSFSPSSSPGLLLLLPLCLCCTDMSHFFRRFFVFFLLLISSHLLPPVWDKTTA